MSITLFSSPRAYTLAQAADGALSITEQSPGIGGALMNEVLGLFNGGATGSVGWTNTLGNAAKIAAGARYAETLRGLPLVNKLVTPS